MSKYGENMNVKKLNKIIDAAKFQYNRLIIICGPGKEKLMKQYLDKYYIENVNISLELGKKLINIPNTKRNIHIHKCLTEIIHKVNYDVMWINRMQLLFHPELRFDPIQFFQNTSRNTTIILSWDGVYNNNKLIYAEPGHHEYSTFSEINAQVIVV